MTIGQFFPPPSALVRVVMRAAGRKRLSPRRGIIYELLTPDLGGRIEFILGTYQRGVSSADYAAGTLRLHQTY